MFLISCLVCPFDKVTASYYYMVDTGWGGISKGFNAVFLYLDLRRQKRKKKFFAIHRPDGIMTSREGSDIFAPLRPPHVFGCLLIVYWLCSSITLIHANLLFLSAFRAITLPSCSSSSCTPCKHMSALNRCHWILTAAKVETDQMVAYNVTYRR